MGHSIRIAIEESSQTAEARRVARKMAADIGFDEAEAERVALVITEACTNIIKHAGRGEVLLRTPPASSPADCSLEALAIDQGPGMTNLDQCLQDGYSTGGSHGQGLGAIMRLSNISDFYTSLNKGTVVLARWWRRAGKGGEHDPRAPLQVGAVNVCKPGQEVCGDTWGVEQAADHAMFVVADGLGHGVEAQTASAEAVRMLSLHPDLPPITLLARIDQALRSSRGAAVAVARIDLVRGKLTFAGVGNIAAQIYSGAKAGQHLVSVNGTAGLRVPRLNEFSYTWPERGMIVFHSDGLTTATGLESHPGLALRDASIIAGVLYRDFNRGQDDSTVVVAKAV